MGLTTNSLERHERLNHSDVGEAFFVCGGGYGTD